MDYTGDVSQYADFDIFFYYGYNDLSVETKSDILQNIMQPKRSLFYDRSQDSAGIQSYENRPNGLYLNINIPFDIVTSLAKRNQIVSDGTGDYPDRRVSLSQSLIKIENKKGNVDVSVQYLPMTNYREEKISFALGNV